MTKQKYTWEGLKMDYGVWFNGSDYYMMGVSASTPIGSLFKLLFCPIPFILWIFRGDD